MMWYFWPLGLLLACARCAPLPATVVLGADDPANPAAPMAPFVAPRGVLPGQKAAVAPRQPVMSGMVMPGMAP